MFRQNMDHDNLVVGLGQIDFLMPILVTSKVKRPK